MLAGCWLGVNSTHPLRVEFLAQLEGAGRHKYKTQSHILILVVSGLFRVLRNLGLAPPAHQSVPRPPVAGLQFSIGSLSRVLGVCVQKHPGRLRAWNLRIGTPPGEAKSFNKNKPSFSGSIPCCMSEGAKLGSLVFLRLQTILLNR